MRRGAHTHTHDVCSASPRHERSILRPEAACPPSNYLAKKKEAEVKTYVIDPGLVRVPPSNRSSRPFLARARAAAAVTEPSGIFARSASFTVYAIYDHLAISRHRHRIGIGIARRRIASYTRSEFYGSPRPPSKNTYLRNNEIITFVTFSRPNIYGVSRTSSAFSRLRKTGVTPSRKDHRSL